MSTWHIHITGRVQGVGFRPFIYRLAVHRKLHGLVKNTSAGVLVAINGEKSDVDELKRSILDEAPIQSRIISINVQVMPDIIFDDFCIALSDATDQVKLHMAPDFAMCSCCREELHDINNRRVNYPFITCTNCGPRYSIAEHIPFDRSVTTMDAFQQCDACHAEYTDASSARFHSQTNSCHTCGIELTMIDSKTLAKHSHTDTIMDDIAKGWHAGHIIAIKGIGGYLLTCDATNVETVSRLRKLKHRPTKPFALMMTAAMTDQYTEMSPIERKEWSSACAPIVLLREKASSLLADNIAPGLSAIGVMTTYTSLYDIVLQRFGRPIVATSANVSGEPIVYQDNMAIETLVDLADKIVTNNRLIVVPQDDSVIRLSPINKKRIIIRRSRGMAPSFDSPAQMQGCNDMLAFGSDLKSTFSLTHQNNLFVSQYVGDLASFSTTANFATVQAHAQQLLSASPTVALCDLHPNYISTQLAEQFAQINNLECKPIQHHEAHFAALLGEHDLLASRNAILGVIWDGIGYGTDNQIWGGEFFIYSDYSFQRVNHLPYIPYLMGDKMSKEPRLSALAWASLYEPAKSIIQAKFTSEEWGIYSRMLSKHAGPYTSSVGRLFDAVASLLDLVDVQQYEGEAAQRLEALAMSFVEQEGTPNRYYAMSTTNYENGMTTLISAIVQDIGLKIAKAEIAYKFHMTLVKYIKAVASMQGAKMIGCSGGVFQNALLVDMIMIDVADEYEVYFHEQLSPNDENISFGQLVHAHIQQKNRLKKELQKTRVCV